MLGGSGFIGLLVVQALKASSVEVLSLSSRQLDLCSIHAPRLLDKVLRPDDHLLFLSAVTPDKGRDLATFRKNLLMAEHVCEFLATSGCAHVTYVSSDAVYRDPAHSITEEALPSPLELYGVAHFARERILSIACEQFSIPLLIIRPVAVYGALDTHNSYGPNRFVRQALTEKRIELFGEGEELRDHLWGDDLADIILALIKRHSTGVVNAATGLSVSFAQVAEEICRLLPHTEVVEIPRQRRITNRTFNTRSLRLALPSLEFTPLGVGLHRMHQLLLSSQGSIS